jgi:DNA-binding LytR/AlgR family response regulator
METPYFFSENAVLIDRKYCQEILPNEIVMLQGFVNYSLVHLTNGSKVMIARTLKHFEEKLLPEGFIRVHRSYLINPKYLGNYNNRSRSITMQNGLEIEVARRRAKFIRQSYKYSLSA